MISDTQFLQRAPHDVQHARKIASLPGTVADTGSDGPAQSPANLRQGPLRQQPGLGLMTPRWLAPGVAMALVSLVLAGMAHAAQLSLRWTDNSLTEDGFLIERRTGPGDFAYIAAVGPSDADLVEFVDTSVDPDTGYCYRVRAYNAAGLSGYSNEACAAPGAADGTAREAAIFAAVLPASRSVLVGSPATAFATLVNAGLAPAVNCGIALPSTLPLAFEFRTTETQTNVATGAPGARVTIPSGERQSFVLAVIPNRPMEPTEVAFEFACDNAAAPIVVGLNTLLVSSSSTPGPDIVALTATAFGDGVVAVPGPDGTGAFAAATANLGVGAEVVVTGDTGGMPLPLDITLCRTDPVTARCISPTARSLATHIEGGEAAATFAVFVQAFGPVPFEPAGHRVFVRFRQDGRILGSTSVAVRTQ